MTNVNSKSWLSHVSQQETNVVRTLAPCFELQLKDIRGSNSLNGFEAQKRLGLLD